MIERHARYFLISLSPGFREKMAGLGYLVYVLLGFLLALAKFKLPRKHDAQEPPLVPAGPLGIGHVVGIARQGKSAYFPGLW